MDKIISHLIFYKEQMMSLIPHVSLIRGKWVSWLWDVTVPFTQERPFTLNSAGQRRGVVIMVVRMTSLTQWFCGFIWTQKSCRCSVFLALNSSEIKRVSVFMFCKSQLLASLLYRPCPSCSGSLGFKLPLWVLVYFCAGELDCQPRRHHPHLLKLSSRGCV